MRNDRHTANLFTGAQPVHPVKTDTPGQARADQPATSAQAAGAVKTGGIRARVLERLCLAGASGLTDDELWVLMGGPESSARKRRSELADPVWCGSKGLPVLAQDSGRTRPNRNGQESVVWIATRYALEHMEKSK